MYNELEIFIISVCAITVIIGYIVLKATEPNFGIINWRYIFKCIKNFIVKLFR